MRGDRVRRSNGELLADWNVFEQRLYHVATPEDLERLLSSTGPGGKFPPEPDFLPGFYQTSPELLTIEAKQYLARVRKDFGEILFKKPPIFVSEE